MSTITATVLLRPGEADRVLAGHPWVYERSILRVTEAAGDGDVVQVKDHRQRFLGIGFFNSRSRIRVRMLHPERVEVDERFFRDRIAAAAQVRERYLPGANALRLVSSEGDLLSGLVVDRYSDVLVVQTSALGMDQRKPMILNALQELFQPRALAERNELAVRRFEGLPEANGVLKGEVEGPVRIQMNGLKFDVDLLKGHKTGFYLDQQINYRLAAELAARRPLRRVLDCFTFLGGFALHLAKAGAAQVHGIDQSEENVRLAGLHAELNGVGKVCSFEAANVFDWLKARTASAENLGQYDCIVLDPPSFTRSRSAVGDALRGYKEIHLRALKLLSPGGLLLTFCCSHHVSGPLFEEAILSAAADAHKVVRRVATFSQSLDHPILPAIPETEYLKGFAYELAR